MNDWDVSETILRYSERYKEHGYSPLTLGWGEKDRAGLRFEIFSQIFDFTDSVVLDFGCGFGDFFDYLLTKNIPVKRYIGVDINPDLIQEAKSRHLSHKNVDFLCENILQNETPLHNVDYIVSSGVFNHKISDADKFVADCFSFFDKVAAKGIACNFLSDKVDADFIDERLNYNSPERTLSLAYAISNNVILRNDYMPFEFSIGINKEQQINPQYTVYERFLKYVKN